ncbi:MAG: DNRLRE domain-containing protein [bacterium]|nr:DNRLRE domain-containing protein [Candidatus Kapabacteria bacterium]
MTTKLAVLAVLAAITVTSCNQLATSPGTNNAAGEVCYWIAANKDAMVSYGTIGQEANLNYGNGGFLAIANGPLGRKMSYVHFTVPTYPAGTEILEAKLELYHSGEREDGSTDDININVGIVRNEAWSPATITWNNQPFRGGNPAIDAALRLRSRAWSGTADIAGAVREMIATPDAIHGFAIWYADASGRQVEKGFYSNNDIRRKQTDLGLSPRLVVKVRFPSGKGTSDATLPFLPADHDLKSLPQPVTTVNFRAGSAWPADWNVSP